MNVIAFCASPRPGGNTETLAGAVLDGAREKGAEIRLVRIADLDLRPCQGCGACRPEGNCVLGDAMDEAASSILAADAVVFASPVYMWQVPGPGKTFIDRMCRFLTPELTSRIPAGKPIGFAYTQGNPEPGAFGVYFDYLERMFGFLGFAPAGRVLATATRQKGDVLRQTKVLEAARELGRRLLASGPKG
ncbi:flavodoxin family protein [Deferrisoma palaeochoriense]